MHRKVRRFMCWHNHLADNTVVYAAANSLSMIIVGCLVQFAFPSVSLADPWISANGKYVAFVSHTESGQIVVWDLLKGAETCRITPLAPYSKDEALNVYACAISESDGVVATGTTFGLSVWDLRSGELLWQDCHPKSVAQMTNAIVFYPEGKHIVYTREEQLVVRRVRDGKGEAIVEDRVGAALQISPSGQRLYGIGKGLDDDECVVAWDAENGSRLGRFCFENADAVMRTGRFSVGDQFLVEHCHSGGEYYFVIWDTEKFSEVRRVPLGNRAFHATPYLDENSGSVFAMFEKPSPVPGRVVREFDLRSGAMLKERLIDEGLATGADDSWTVAVCTKTSAFYWLSSDHGRRSLMLASRAKDSRSTADLMLQSYESRRDAAVLIFGENRGVVFGDQRPLLTYASQPREFGNRIYQVWYTKEAHSSSIVRDSEAVKAKLDELNARTERHAKKTDPSKPRLFVLAVGISDYEFNEYDLQYAHDDAEAITSAFQSQHGDLFGDVQVQLLQDAVATPDRIREGLAWLQRSCQPEDLAVVFFSGHGLRGKKGLYYFSCLGDEENIQNTCVNWADVATSLSTTQASQILFLSDCCHAGAFSKDHYVTQDQIAEVISKAGHVAIFASSAGAEPSLELSGSVKQGAFTAAILEGMNGAADSSADGLIRWSELVKFVSERVPELTNDSQHPVELKRLEDSKDPFLTHVAKQTAVGPPRPPAVIKP